MRGHVLSQMGIEIENFAFFAAIFREGASGAVGTVVGVIRHVFAREAQAAIGAGEQKERTILKMFLHLCCSHEHATAKDTAYLLIRACF